MLDYGIVARLAFAVGGVGCARFQPREEEEAALLTAKRKVDDVVVSYILPAEKAARSRRLDHDGFYDLLSEMTAKYPKEWKEVRDKYEADGITKHSPRFNAMLDRYEELFTVLRSMTDEAKE